MTAIATIAAGMAELSRWPTVAEAAALLKLSRRSLERRIAAGEIEMRKRARPGKKPEPVCNPRDLEELAPQAHALPPMRLASIPPMAAESGAIAAMLREWLSITPGDRKPAEDSQRRWLTLEEAAQFSGLSARFLGRKRGQLGVKDGRIWKIDRRKLEAFESSAAGSRKPTSS
ncbi:MAG: hypothetical protein ACRD4O_10350 [Bryobacteraceae bacterium]